MTVVLDDLRNTTRVRVENVVRLEFIWSINRGRPTRYWFLELADGKTRNFKMKDYSIYYISE